LTPTQLGDFRILREIGRGGMGVVYEAEQISLKRRVALKVLRYGAAADSEAMQRFQREAETVARLHHTNIVPIFAIGCENGVNYYAMQFIEGRSLAEVALASGGRQSPEYIESRIDGVSANSEGLHPPLAIANWGLQAAEALAHAHHRGVIHRDIKPSNLILDPDGRIWLTDFGLAKRMDDVSLSITGAILGTPRYMSPEQAAATANPVDHRTDIYSLGATLYELATGRPLFEADSPHAVITQILTCDPPAPRVVCPNLHRDFETIVLKCLAKEPAQRYATAQALADDLRAFVEGRAIKARRATLAEQAARWFKQQKRSVGVAVAAVAVTIAVVVGSLIAWQMHGQSRLGYLTLNTPREDDQRAEVAEVLSLADQPVLAPFTLPTKEPLALAEGAYRLRLTAPSRLSQTYLFDIAAGAQVTHEVGLVNETVGNSISLRSPVGVAVVQRSRHAPRDEPNASTTSNAESSSIDSSTSNARSAHHAERNPPKADVDALEPRLFVGPQDSSKPTLKCYSVRSQPQERVVQEGSSIDVRRSTEPMPLWEANWSLEAPDIISFLKLPADREAWKVLPAQTDVFAWQQVLAWFDPWWFRPQDSQGAACRLATAPIWCGDVIVVAVRSVNDSEERIEALSPRTGESLWRHNAGTVGWCWLTTATIDGEPSVFAVIQDRLFVLDAATGDPKLGTPAYLDWSESGKIVVKPEDSTGLHKGTVLLADMRFAELDSDGLPEALLSVFGPENRVDIVALSLARREALWQVASSVTVGPGNPFQGSLSWPFVTDLDGDASRAADG
jgi:tRNA A-37 threonylcarbamoyl transferase component Bud32